MARRKLIAEPNTATKNNEIAQQVELSGLVASYGENKTELDTLDKECKKQNAKIKELMIALKRDEYESGGYVAKYSVQHRESMNEDKLLELLSKDYQYYLDLGIIRQKDYIDSDALEDAIYHEKIEKDVLLEMDKCRETKEVPTLKIVKIKEK